MSEVGLLRADAQRLWKRLEKAEKCDTYTDPYGAVWQYGGAHSPYWYRAFDSDHPVSAFELAQRGVRHE